MKKNYIIHTVIFVVVFMMIFCAISNVLVHPEDERNYQWVKGFYEEEENSLDVVCIGSSKMYAFWNSLVAWEEYGITGYPYTTNDQYFLCTEYIIKEAVKTQPNAVFVVNTNAIRENDLDLQNAHYILDYMPFSLNKLQLTNYLVKLGDFSSDENLGLYIPMVQYHTRWSELKKKDFEYELNGLKGANSGRTYREDCVDVSDKYFITDEKEELYEELLDGVDSLLDYCDKENIKVLFVTPPCVEAKKGLINSLNELIADRGYPVLDMTGKVEEIGLDLTQDYYNKSHTNIHGSIKYTRYLAEYLIDNYGFTDKRGDEAYSSWDEGLAKYSEIMSPYVLDIELEPEHLTDKLDKVTNLTSETQENENVISWTPSEGSDGSAIYRQLNGGKWTQIATTSETTFADTDRAETGTYSYRVVPFMEKDGELLYGSFSYKGTSVEVK